MELLEERSRRVKAGGDPIGCDRWLVRGSSSVGCSDPIGRSSLVEAEGDWWSLRAREEVRRSSGAGYVEADDRRQFAGHTGVDDCEVLVARGSCGLWYL